MPQTSGDAPILATKLFVPPPRDNVVARSRLRDRLAAAREGRVTLIAAAAGWGKSTLLADWALSTPGEQCAQNGQACAVGRAFYRNNARGQMIGDAKGMIKLVFAPDTLRLLGVHIIGEDAAELLHVGMMVMQFGGTINAFIEGVFNFPTLSEAYKYAAYDGLGNVGRRRLLERSNVALAPRCCRAGSRGRGGLEARPSSVERRRPGGVLAAAQERRRGTPASQPARTPAFHAHFAERVTS